MGRRPGLSEVNLESGGDDGLPDFAPPGEVGSVASLQHSIKTSR